MNFGESLTIQTYRHPHKIAVEDDCKGITYQRLNERVNSLAHGLREIGLRKGSIVCQLQGNSIEHVELLYAVAKGGMIRLPLSPRAEKSEFIHIINSFEPEALLFEDEFTPVVAEIRPQLKCPRFIHCGSNPLPHSISYEDLATRYTKAEPAVEVQEGDPYLVQSTSGSTGMPKAALLSQGGMIRRSIFRAMDSGNHSRGIYVAVTALANTASIFFALSQLYIGGTIILRNRFDPVNTLKTIEEKKATFISMVPIMWERILQVPDLRRYDLSSLEIAISYGAPLHQSLKERLIREISPNVSEAYGITETGPITLSIKEEHLTKIDCVGKPTMHTKIRVLGSDGQEVPIGQQGEIVVRTPYMFMCYFKNPQATAEVLRGDWFYTGDVGNLDEDHSLYIVGRSKDMIISGGYNIYAEEVERVIGAHPAIQEVAVIGVPDEKWGEAVKAMVVVKPGMQVRESDIIDFCRDRLAGYKKPKSVDFLTSLPRIAVGKVAKQKLREKYWRDMDRKVH